MKQKRDKNHKREPTLEKEVNTPNGKYSCKIIKDENSVFSRYALDMNKPKGVLSCSVEHNNASKFEKFLGLDSIQKELTYLSFEGTEISQGNYKVSSEVENISYDAINSQFIVSFYHSITFSDGLTTPLPKRFIQIPVPKTPSRKLTDFLNNYLKKIFNPKPPSL